MLIMVCAFDPSESGLDKKQLGGHLPWHLPTPGPLPYVRELLQARGGCLALGFDSPCVSV